MQVQFPMNQPKTPSALVVDDNEFNRDICRIALEYAGYKVSQAVNGEEALKLLQTQGFNLMILDLQMPIVDGYTVLKTVRSDGHHEDLYVIVMTAHEPLATNEVKEAANYVIYKPIDIVGFAGFANHYKHSLDVKH